jgi:hypothetical protein
LGGERRGQGGDGGCDPGIARGLVGATLVDQVSVAGTGDKGGNKREGEDGTEDEEECAVAGSRNAHLGFWFAPLLSTPLSLPLGFSACCLVLSPFSLH